MKKILFGLILFFTGLISVNAAPVDLYASSRTVTVGQAVIITVKSNDAVGKYSVSSNNGNVLSGSFTNGFRTKGEAPTYRFVAKNPGSAAVVFTPQNMALYSNDTKYTAPSSITITVVPARQLSTNNNLSSLGIDGLTLSPEFNSDTLEYTAVAEAGTDKINVTGNVADQYASLTGTGEKEVSEGDNNIEITVTAENGATKTYKINVTVKEFNPIKVKVDNKEYTVVRNKKSLIPPNNYVEKVEIINGEEIPTYYSEITKYTLVSLKDEKGNQNWYVKDKEYKLYKEYKFGSTILYPMEIDKIPEKYSKTKIEYNKEKIVAYKINEKSKYALIHGMNVETGEIHTYMYDSKEDTVQIYNDELINKLQDENKLYLKILIGVSTGLFLSIGIIIFILIKNKKKNI